MMKNLIILLCISCLTGIIPENIHDNARPDFSCQNVNMDWTSPKGTELIIRIDTDLCEDAGDYDNSTPLYLGETVVLIDFKDNFCHVQHGPRKGYVYSGDLCTIGEMIKKVQRNKPKTYKLLAAADVFYKPGKIDSISGKLQANSEVIFIAYKVINDDLWNLVIYNNNKTGWIKFNQIEIDNKTHYTETVINGRIEDFYHSDEGSYFEYTFLQQTNQVIRKGPQLVIALNKNKPIYFLDGLSTEDSTRAVLCGKYGSFLLIEERFDEGVWVFFININNPDDRESIGFDPVFSPGGTRFFSESCGPPGVPMSIVITSLSGDTMKQEGAVSLYFGDLGIYEASGSNIRWITEETITLDAECPIEDEDYNTEYYKFLVTVRKRGGEWDIDYNALKEQLAVKEKYRIE